MFSISMFKPLIKKLLPTVISKLPGLINELRQKEKSVQLEAKEEKACGLIWFDNNENEELKISIVTVDQQMAIKRVIVTHNISEAITKYSDVDHIMELIEKHNLLEKAEKELKNEI